MYYEFPTLYQVSLHTFRQYHTIIIVLHCILSVTGLWELYRESSLILFLPLPQFADDINASKMSVMDALPGQCLSTAEGSGVPTPPSGYCLYPANNIITAVGPDSYIEINKV